MEDKIFDMGKQKPVAGVVRDSWQHQLWWIFIVLTVMCLYWLSNIVLWVPWSHSPRLGMLLMLTVNPLFWGIGIYACLSCGSNAGNLMKKALFVSLVAVGISLLSDFLFFAVCMESKDVWHITTFYGYAWLVILALGEAFFLPLNPQLHSRSATYIKRNGLLIRKITIKSSRPFQCAYHPLTP